MRRGTRSEELLIVIGIEPAGDLLDRCIEIFLFDFLDQLRLDALQRQGGAAADRQHPMVCVRYVPICHSWFLDSALFSPRCSRGWRMHIPG